MRATPAVIPLICLLTACGSESTTGPAPVRPVTWVPNAYVQPVPQWGSPVRLNLPVPLASIRLDATGGIGAFGAHEGGHVEGLNHVWIATGGPTTVRTWAAGKVTKIEDQGVVYSNGGHEFFVTVDYGQGLIGKHLDMTSPSVTVGASLREGDVVGQGQSAEFMLIDMNRTDGERTGGDAGSFVSPFDYLRPDVQQALLARYMAEVVEPYFRKGLSVGTQRPWEPRLTNPELFHPSAKGTIAGEWIATNKGWSVVDPLYFDVMTIFDVTNEFGHFQRYEAMDHDWSKPGNKNHVTGRWIAGDAPGRIMFVQDGGPTFFGLYTVDESSGRAKLTLEWRIGSYPAALSATAATYVERAPIYLGGDVQALGLIR